MKQLLGRYLSLFLVALLGVMPSAWADQLTINRGVTAGDGTGETLYSAFGKVNANFQELYGAIGTAAEQKGASPSASASTNAAAIQAALNVGGLVTLNRPGIYQIGSTLKIGSNTNFVLGTGVEIKASGSGVGNLLTATVMDAVPATVTITYTANSMLATVNWTGHGVSTSDYVWLTGADQYQYLGVFPVVSVPDANSFVVKLRRQPTAAATGLIKAVIAQRNTAIRGGVWNYNYTGGNAPAGYLRNAIRLGGIYNLNIENITGKDTFKYVLDIGGVTNFRFRGGYGSGLAADFIKLRGPMFNADVSGIDASTGDDVLSVQTKEPAAYADYNWTWGDAIGIKISGIGGQSATAGIVLYPTNADGILDGITIDGFTGTMVTNPQIRIDNNGTGVGNVGVVTINSPVFSGANAAIYIKGAQNIENLLVLNPKQNSANNQGRFISTEPAAINANIKVVGGSLSRCESLMNLSHTSGSVIRADFDNVKVSDSIWNTFSIGGAGTTYLRIRNLMMGVNPGNAMFNISGTSIVYVDADRITNPSGSHVLVTSGTPTIYTQNSGWKVDLSLVGRIDGVVAYNSNAALGTLGAAGLVVGQGTSSGSWHLLADPTKAY